MAQQAPRPHQKLAKLAYKILKTPKDIQQKNTVPDKKLRRAWYVDSIMAQ